MNHYKLLCLGTGDVFEDDGFMLANPASPKPALLRAVYNRKALRVQENLPGIYRFSDWLPILRTLPKAGSPVTYRSEALAAHLGLTRLYVTFNGWWPEKGADLASGTFKECEALSVCARLPEASRKILVVASAGNTARAFMQVASKNGIPLLAVVPERCLGSLWSDEKIEPCVHVAAAGGDSDYSDAIELADRICKTEGFLSEGGAKNVARRDGMGTTVLSAATTTGEIPDFYFQAVGSGTGAIAAHEANLRLNESGQYAPKAMKLVVSQNAPFLTIYEAWKAGLPATREMSAEEARRKMELIDAKVLSNRKPPYGIKGGLYEALKASGGDVVSVTNEEARAAQRLFEELEGCDIGPESGVALASLIQKAREGAVPADALVMLNVTGGGTQRLKASAKLHEARADAVFMRDEFQSARLAEFLRGILRNEPH
jgi:cysteate synthase